MHGKNYFDQQETKVNKGEYVVIYAHKRYVFKAQMKQK